MTTLDVARDAGSAVGPMASTSAREDAAFRRRVARAWARAETLRRAFDVWARARDRAVALRAFEGRRCAVRARVALEAWRRAVAVTRERTRRARTAAAFGRWRRRAAETKRMVALAAYAVRHDRFRVMCGAFVRWCGRVRAAREMAENEARAAAFWRRGTLARAFYAWRFDLSRARLERTNRQFRLFTKWRLAVRRARALEDVATAFVETRAATFGDKYLLPGAFETWRAFVLAQRRRYVAMDFAEKSSARRALRAWKRFGVS